MYPDLLSIALSPPLSSLSLFLSPLSPPVFVVAQKQTNTLTLVSYGGVLLSCQKGSIITSNTLETRLQQAIQLM